MASDLSKRGILRSSIVCWAFLLSCCPAMAAGTDGRTDFALVPWDPMSGVQVLPYTPEIAGTHQDRLILAACPGEVEPASFVIQADKNLAGIRIRVSDLITATGRTLAASCVDVRLVKCWYQAGGDTRYNTGRRVLKPELLLKDDSLVQTTLTQGRSFLKVTLDRALQQVSADGPLPAGAVLRDAAHLLPFDLVPRENRQVWLSVHVPPDAAPDRYQGSIRVAAPGTRAQVLKFVIEVLPFKLAPPVLTYSLYYRGKLTSDRDPPLGSDWKTPYQYRLEMADMRAHGILSPVIYQKPGSGLVRQALALRREAGIDGPNLYVFGTRAEAVTAPRKLTALQAEVRNWISMAHEFGYREVYIYGRDEARGAELTAQSLAWQAVHKAGARMFTACYPGAVQLVGDILDLPVLGGGAFAPDETAKWHARGKPVLMYNNPQVGIENPALYRLNYGFELWRQGYDGGMNYAYQHAMGEIWNDFDHPRFRDHVFAYPTSDGLVGTVQWEGFREAVDDIRYLSTLLKYESEARVRAWLAGLLDAQTPPARIREGIIAKVLGHLKKTAGPSRPNR